MKFIVSMMTGLALPLSAITYSHALDLGDVGKVIAAPITAPIQATQDILRGAPPNVAVQN